MTDHDQSALLGMTTGIIANYVAKNHITPDDLPGLISSVHGALVGAGAPDEEIVERPDRLTPAQIRKLVTPAGITSLIDGRVFQSLKRHLGRNGHTPETYRDHFGLPSDFPMVSPTYAERRSELAKSIGLGRKPLAKTARTPKASTKA